MTPASCKAKGRALQQAVCAAIRKAFPHLEPDDVRSCSMGSNGEDVLLSPLARKSLPFSIECKAKATGFTALYDALAQAGGQGPYAPLAVVKQDRRQPLAVLPLAEFLALLALLPGAPP